MRGRVRPISLEQCLQTFISMLRLMLETQPVSEISEAELLQCLEDEGQSEKPQKQDKTSLRELSTLLDNFYYSVYFKEGRRLDSLKSLLYLRG